LSEEWYARPVLFVADIDRTLDFYVNRLGFAQTWRHEDNGKAFVAQVDRQGCAFIFSAQWPDKVGKGLMFISLNVNVAKDQFRAEVESALDKLRVEFETKGVDVKDGWWGSWSFAIPMETSSILTTQMLTKHQLQKKHNEFD
jgi:catechol 2,3-dioxygenase-like lactoylglutathione lyase family enzyme